MNEDLKVLTAIRDNILLMIDKYGAEPYDKPMDSSTYEYIQDEVRMLSRDRLSLGDPIAKDAMLQAEKFLKDVPNEDIIVQMCKVRAVLDEAINKIKKTHYPLS